MTAIKYILYPFSLLYGLVLSTRNACFDLGILKQATFPTPVISVGNITVGGTGKTPMVEFIIRNLSSRYKIATLSRGYRRATRGVIIASKNDNAQTIGDEPHQIASKFPGITVAVAEKRVEGIRTLLKQESVPDMILMDDAYQHRHVKPGLSILLVDFNRPIWNDTPFPGGRLREFARGSRRADIVVVTKCPQSISQLQKDTFVKNIKGAKPENTFFAAIRHGSPCSLSTGAQQEDFFKINNEVVLLTAIAQPQPLIEHVNSKTSIVKHFSFGDHHQFSEEEVHGVVSLCNTTGIPLLTTEKDATRLRLSEAFSQIKNDAYSIPIDLDFVDGREKEFVYQIYKYLANA